MTYNLSNSPLLKKFAEIFVNELDNFRLAGGAVRDILLDKTPQDFDLASKYHPAELMELCDILQVKYIPSGLQYGTITILLDDQPLEITSLRKDLKTDGRHAEVTYCSDFAEDALRRDFTINALYISFDGKLHDYVGGKQDLENKLLRFVGEPAARIKEDYLRILRLLRFYAQLPDFALDEPALTAACDLKEKLTLLSAERIKAELWKLLAGKNLIAALKLNQKTQLIDPLLKLNYQAELNFHLPLKALVKFARLYLGQNLQHLKIILKLSNHELELLKFLAKAPQINEQPQLGELQKLNYLYGTEKLEYLLEFKALKSGILIKPTAAELGEFILPISGNDLIAQGFTPGKELGQKLKEIESAWLASDFKLSKEELLKLL